MDIDIEIRQHPQMTVAYLAMSGPFDQIPAGYGRLYGWVAQHGLQPTEPPRAVYLTRLRPHSPLGEGILGEGIESGTARSPGKALIWRRTRKRSRLRA